jgi:hypothetical protein
MNAKIKLKESFPLCYKEFVKLNGHEAENFNNAIDNLLITFGLGMIVSPVYSEKTDNVLGYISKLRIYPQNELSLKSEDIVVNSDFNRIKSLYNAQLETMKFSLNFLEQRLEAIK